jgi:superfamily I DNA/RNA helicase
MMEILYFLRQGLKVCIAGEKKAAELRAIAQAALDLQKNKWTSHPDFKDFRRWQDVVDSVTDEEDGDAGLSSMVNVIVRNGAEDVIAAIDSCVPADEADITVSTVHVAKGLEWRHVRISTDFREPKIDKLTAEVSPMRSDEAMILYVAITRAKAHLDAQNIAWIVDYNGGIEG